MVHAHAGRVQTILFFKFTAVALLGLIGLFPVVWTELGIIIPAYVIRTAIMNSAFPLQKSILMDYVPKVSAMHHRCIICCCFLSAVSALHAVTACSLT